MNPDGRAGAGADGGALDRVGLSDSIVETPTGGCTGTPMGVLAALLQDDDDGGAIVIAGGRGRRVVGIV